MFVYIIICLVIIIVGVFTYKEGKTSKGFWILYPILAILAGIRGEMSTDHPHYVEHFLSVKIQSLAEIFTKNYQMEKGFVLLNKIISVFTSSPVIFILIISAITIGLYFLAYKKRSQIPWLAILLFFAVGDYFDAFNAVRQILAASICFYATKYISTKVKRGFIKYFLLILLASTIHTSALIMIPMYFIMKIKFTKKTLLAYGVVGIAAYVFLPSLVDLLQRIYPRYDIYGDWESATSNFNSVIPILGIFIFVLMSIYFFNVDFDLDNGENKMAMHGLCWALIFMILGLQMYLASRFSHYFKPFVAIAVTNIIIKFKSDSNRKSVIAAISIAAILFIWIVHNDSPYNPYYIHPEVIEFFR